MKILAIDTSEIACSVALLVDASIIERHQRAPQQHTQYILPFIQELLSESGFSLSQLDVLAFGRGPGSFTGLRIAAGVIQGLAYAVNLPVVGISTLRALAQGAYRQFGASYVKPMMDARMEQVYWGLYQLDENGYMQPLLDDAVSSPSDISPHGGRHKSFVGIGSGWSAYPQTQSQLSEVAHIVYVDQYVYAQDIATLAVLEFQKGNMVQAEDALPVYLRDWR
ncbi:MAG: tRNA (adenosine(37)-N6)-threonylcarbamoyltransferase complex dimerization subunit type 1 TsaB [Gammaproteobacteria bacterium]|nr:tRNA (adenosine(37)-N6)-threonylcarbamoyltransferase complex dimerization subunit type 1 TsaB [Gammaproteobacteria bacterium]